MTAQIATPGDLGSAQEGLSIIDPAGPLTRTWYFDGRFLRADGFRADQAYERALAALVAQGAGAGVVHGLEASLGTGDRLRVEAGLALAPSGRVVLLTREVDLPTANLISRAQGALDPSVAPAPAGSSAFTPCPPETLDAGAPVLPATALWVLTVAATETLCGQEERFGQLCADACATETDRSLLVEGVLFRVRPLSLTLPAPRTVPMTPAHLQSRVAAAWFAAERQATAPIISGAGLRSMLWCQGAEAIGGEEVPLAVLHREGEVSSWLDAWTARRELHEATPRRYWQQRIAMRPESLASAELLQFQCQLAGLTLPASSAVSSSVLLDTGVVELPAAGYLVVDPAGDVEAQLRARFGRGVDLRFCVARADVVPRLLEAARHRDRISLTRGLDDVGDLEEVDILVPDGTVTSAPGAASAYVGEAKALPVTRDGESGAAIVLATMARDSSAAGWTWAAAGIGELPAPVLPDPLVRFARGQTQRQRRLAAVDAALQAMIRPDGVRVASGRSIAAWAQLVTPTRVEGLQPGETTDVRVRFTFTAATEDVSLMDARFTGELRVVDRVVGQDSGAPSVQLTTVLDGFLDVFTVDDGQPKSRVTPLQAVTLGWLFGTDENGAAQLQVAMRQGLSGLVFTATRSGSPSRITAGLGRFVLGPGRPDSTVPPPVRPPVTSDDEPGWTSGVREAFARMFDRISASGLLSKARLPVLGGSVGPAPGVTPIGTAELTDTPGATAPGSATRTRSDTAIELLAAALAAHGRDPAFAVGARALLYGAEQATSRVHATRDWVLFSRRETISCPAAEVVPPTLRTLRLLHATITSEDQLKVIVDRLSNRQPLGDFGFTPIVDLEFPEHSAEIVSSIAALRIAWQSAPRPSELGLIASAGDREGQLVAAGRVEALRSALEGLVETSNAQIAFLPSVPPEFAAIGVDAVLLTAGVRAEPVTTCARLLRVSRIEAARLEQALRSLPDDPGVQLEEFMVQQQVPVDAVSASFTDAGLTNKDEVRAWWGRSSALAITALLPADLGDGSDPLDARIGRAKDALALLDLAIRDTTQFPIHMDPCGVAVLIIRE